MSSFAIPQRARKPRTDQFGRTVERIPLVSTDTVNELLVTCTGCGLLVLVCGFVEDLPDAYRCLECRPFKRDFVFKTQGETGGLAPH